MKKKTKDKARNKLLVDMVLDMFVSTFFGIGILAVLIMGDVSILPSLIMGDVSTLLSLIMGFIGVAVLQTWLVMIELKLYLDKIQHK